MNKRTITNAYKSPLGRGVGIGGNEDSDITKTIYGFGSQDPKVGEPSLYTNQILHNSDRITINAKKDCIFLSAFKHIHMGSGNVMTFSTSKNILMEAETTLDCNIGEEVNIKSPIINLGEGEEPLAKGDELVNTLSDIIDAMDSLIDECAKIAPSGGSSGGSPPVNAGAINSVKRATKSIKRNLNNI